MERERLKEIISCPICHEIYEEPRTLPCLHNFCDPCLKEYIGLGNRECPCCRLPFEGEAADHGRSFLLNGLIADYRAGEVATHGPRRCDQCPCDEATVAAPAEKMDGPRVDPRSGQPVVASPADVSHPVVAALASEEWSLEEDEPKKIDGGKVHRRSVHPVFTGLASEEWSLEKDEPEKIDSRKVHRRSTEAVVVCKQCGDCLCQYHRDVHENTRTLASHCLLSMDMAAEVKRRHSEACCAAHPDKKVKLFCVTCNDVICRDCTYATHRSEDGHRCYLISAVLASEQAEVRRLAKEIQDAGRAVEAAHERVTRRLSEVERESDLAMARMDSYMNDLYERLDERDLALTRRVNALRTARTKKLTSQLRALEGLRACGAATASIVDLPPSDAVRMLRAKRLLLQCAQRCNDLEDEYLPCADADVRFVAPSDAALLRLEAEIRNYGCVSTYRVLPLSERIPSEMANTMAPHSIAFDASERLHVTDSQFHRVLVFASLDDDLVFVRSFGRHGRGDGEFRNPTALAVERSTGRVAVVDSHDHRVQVFDAEGNFLQKIVAADDCLRDEERTLPASSLVSSVAFDPVRGLLVCTNDGWVFCFNGRGDRETLIDPSRLPAMIADRVGRGIDGAKGLASGFAWPIDDPDRVMIVAGVGTDVVLLDVRPGSQSYLTVSGVGGLSPNGRGLHLFLGHENVALVIDRTDAVRAYPVDGHPAPSWVLDLPRSVPPLASPWDLIQDARKRVYVVERGSNSISVMSPCEAVNDADEGSRS